MKRYHTYQVKNAAFACGWHIRGALYPSLGTMPRHVLVSILAHLERSAS